MAATASSPILTYGSTATRAADDPIVPLAATMPTGTIVVDAVTNVAAGQLGVFSINDGTANEYIDARTLGAGFVADGGATQVTFSYAPMTAGVLAKTAVAWAVNDFAASRNGGTVSTDTSGTVPTVTQIQLGNLIGTAGTYSINGGITRLRVYGKRLPNAQLQALTQ
jgi:hypothetical protein